LGLHLGPVGQRHKIVSTMNPIPMIEMDRCFYCEEEGDCVFAVTQFTGYCACEDHAILILPDATRHMKEQEIVRVCDALLRPLFRDFFASLPEPLWPISQIPLIRRDEEGEWVFPIERGGEMWTVPFYTCAAQYPEAVRDILATLEAGFYK
jgi:hypothetical protein